jgi:hypothetical protein
MSRASKTNVYMSNPTVTITYQVEVKLVIPTFLWLETYAEQHATNIFHVK